MALADFSGSVDERRYWSTAELGDAVATWAVRTAAAECRWLALLAEFDLREGWSLDGKLSAVEWLVWCCGMSARTARDKVRVAHELNRRPEVAEAFSSGRLSYCKVRAITRVIGAGEEVDRWLLRLAGAGTVADLERAVRHWQHLEEQERGVDDYLQRFDRRGVSASRTYDGMVVLEVVLPLEEGVVLPLEEGEEVLRLLDAQGGGSREPQSGAHRRADALVELLRAGSGGAGTPGVDRYTLHLVADVDTATGRFGDHAELLDGSPISAETLRLMSCDCGVVRHLFRGRSQPLDIGTRTSVWTVAQRRSISVRDGGRCRFVACERRTCDVHHVRHFEDGGPTAVHNGILLCPRHHTAVHEAGLQITGEPNGTATFHRPDGITLGSTTGGRQAPRA
ncbi:MAG: DUF222 domain-containing protein [Acidimicrobiales bacterium]